MTPEKRSAQASPGPRAKRAKQALEIRPKIEKVVSAIEELPCDVPFQARAMLASGASAALGTSVEERHPLQDHHVRLLEDFLLNCKIYETFQTKISDAKRVVDEKQADIDAKSVALEVAGAELAEASAVVDAEHAKVKECKSAVAAMNEVKKKTLSAKQKLEKAKATIEAEKTKYVLIEESFTALLNGTWEADKEAQKNVNKLMRDLQKFGAESSLTTSAPTSLLKPPSNREGFDTVIIDTVKTFISALITKVDEKLTENGAEIADLEKSLAQNVEAAEKAVLESQEQSQQYQSARDKDYEKAKAQEEAALALDAAKAELTTHLKVASDCKAEADRFDEVLAEFKFLSAWSSEVPQVSAETMEVAA